MNENPQPTATTAAPTSPPSGTVTFLFTDIEGSTQRWERDRVAMARAVARHDELVRAAIEAAGGYVFKTVGDAFCAAFATAPAALAAALAAERSVASEDWSAVDGLRVRMALHTGNADERDGDYFGPAVNRVARLLGLGHGGQVLVSGVTSGLVQGQLPPEATFHDLGRHRLKDLVHPEQVYQLLAPDLQRDFPALPSLDAVPNNLPLQVTGFVGRDREVAEIAALLGTSRLVTLVGSGGIGKTRTALQVGADLLAGSGDGVWFVEFAPIADASLVPAQIAHALGVQLPAAGDPIESLVRALKNKALLVILDNCEHVVADAARVVDAIIRTCPRVTVLATSRQGLGIAGEATYRLPSLGLPEAAKMETLRAGDAAQYGAIALFVARAKAADAGFALSDESAPIVANICRRLDGIALAIELAAARVKLLNPRGLLQRLDERFRVLAGGSRTALPRQQTLRALIDWSHDLLGERERVVFRRAGIFAGSFAFEGAAAVGCDENIDELELFDVLASLVDKSLLVPDTSGDTPRYRFLESTRVYACERLEASGERERCEEKRFAFLLTLFEGANAAQHSSGREAPILALEPDVDDWRASIEWALARDEPLAAAALFAAAPGFLWLLIGLTEVLTLAQRLLTLVGPEHPRVRALLLRVFGATLNRSGKYPIEVVEEALSSARDARDPHVLADVLAWSGSVQGRLELFEEAHASLEEAERITPPTPLRRANILRARALAAGLCGDSDTAIRVSEQLVALHRSLGNRAAEFVSAQNLAENLHAGGQTVRAVEVAREAIQRLAADLPVQRSANIRVNLSGYHLALGDLRSARETIAESLEILIKYEPESFLFYALLMYLATIAAECGDIDTAARLHGASQRVNVDGGLEGTEKFAAEYLAALLRKHLSDAKLSALKAEGAAWSLEYALEMAARVQRPM